MRVNRRDFTVSLAGSDQRLIGERGGHTIGMLVRENGPALIGILRCRFLQSKRGVLFV